MENNNKEESREFYVYKHIRKDNNTCFYVGKGKGRRIYVPKRNKHYNKIRKKYGCYVVKIKENLTEKEAFALEREIIEDYVFVFGYGINIDGYRDYSNKKYLTNCTWGGEGTSGMHCSDETKRKISESNKGKNAGKNHPLYGKHRSDETKRKTSESMKGKMAGEKHPLYDKNHSEESKLKMSESHKGKASKKVICITTGKIFNSQTQASDYYNVARSNISNCCKEVRKTAGELNGVRLQWKYLKNYNNEFKGILINPII